MCVLMVMVLSVLSIDTSLLLVLVRAETAHFWISKHQHWLTEISVLAKSSCKKICDMQSLKYKKDLRFKVLCHQEMIKLCVISKTRKRVAMLLDDVIEGTFTETKKMWLLELLVWWLNYCVLVKFLVFHTRYAIKHSFISVFLFLSDDSCSYFAHFAHVWLNFNVFSTDLQTTALTPLFIFHISWNKLM